MDQVTLGMIGIGLQHEQTPNEDVYRIGSDSFGAAADSQQIRRLILDHIEDPERFVVNEESGGVAVYTKQPDAAVELAVFLNRRRGSIVSDREIEDVRGRMIRLQH